MGKAIGIDLGTTNSCVSVMEGGRAVIISNTKGERTTPSVVAFGQNGERLVGSEAQHQASVNSKRTVSSVKRHMGSAWRFPVDGKNWTPQEISAIILRRLREDAEAYLGEKVTDAVITVPAYFNDSQRQATKDAGRIAGLNVLRIINEPTSAALAYGLNKGEAQKILVYDLGGGTFDVSIIEIGESVIEVLATCGDNHLGGDDFDDRIVQFILGELKRLHQTDLSSDSGVLFRIREAAEQAKKELSTAESAQITLPYLGQKKDGSPLHFEMTLTRSKFETLIEDLVEKTAAPVQSALNDAGIAASELKKVLLVGGSTRVPAVYEKVKRLTGLEPSRGLNPDECVAQGAAIQAETLSSSHALSVHTGILLLDVIPLSLSIETVGGVATRLIERNTTLPIHYSQIFTTAAPFQSSVDIRVLQGERPMARDNKTIGNFRLKGIKRAPQGVPQIEVTFDIDTNGILRVSAKDKDTGKEQSITITDNEKMSEDEIAAAIRDAEQYASRDERVTDALSLCNQAKEVLYSAQKQLEMHKKEIDKTQKKELQNCMAALQKKTARLKPETMTEEDVASLKNAVEELQQKVSILS